MSSAFERRVEKLRMHVLSHEADTYDNKFIKDIEEAHELAVKEDDLRVLKELKVDELRELAKGKGIEGYSKMKKDELIQALAGE